MLYNQEIIKLTNTMHVHMYIGLQANKVTSIAYEGQAPGVNMICI